MECGKCVKCGREIKEGETYFIFINPDKEWWLELFSSLTPSYCKSCAKEVEVENKPKKAIRKGRCPKKRQ